MSKSYPNDEEKAFALLALYGVPRERARTVANGLDVLMTRIEKERKCWEMEKAALIKERDNLEEVNYTLTGKKIGLILIKDQLSNEIKELRALADEWAIEYNNLYFSIDQKLQSLLDKWDSETGRESFAPVFADELRSILKRRVK